MIIGDLIMSPPAGTFQFIRLIVHGLMPEATLYRPLRGLQNDVTFEKWYKRGAI